MNALHPLSAPVAAGKADLTRLGLRTEAPVALDNPALDGLDDRVFSAHAPFSRQGKRLNVGCTDDAWRDESIQLQRDYIRACERFPNVAKVVCHLAPKIWFDAKTGALEQRGDYGRLIDALAGHADLAAQQGLMLVLENNRSYYHHQMPNAPGTPGGESECEYFSALPEEWLQIVRDVGRDNCRACLDTSHACTSAHRFPHPQRDAVMMAYLADPGLIGHVHWNGNDLDDISGREDQHLTIDAGRLPAELHPTIAGLDATLHLEHFVDVAALERELAFVGAL